MNQDNWEEKERETWKCTSNSCKYPDSVADYWIERIREAREKSYEVGYATGNPNRWAQMIQEHFNAGLQEGNKIGRTAAIEEALKLRKVFAEIEHEQWIEWSKSIAENENISFERFARWQKLWKPYSLLTEEEKDQDRKYSDKILAALSALVNKPQ